MHNLRSAIPGVVWPAVPAAAGAAILAALFQLERSQWWSPQKIWEHQRTQLGALLSHVVNSCPYYARSLGETASRFTLDFSPEQFSRLPILTRSEAQRHYDDIRSRNLPRQHGQTYTDGTSGSTAEPVRFLTTDLAKFFWQAFNLRDHLWNERDFSLKLVTIRAGADHGTVQNWFGEVGETTMQTGPCVSISPEIPIEQQAKRVIEEDPAYLTGYINNLIGVLECVDRLGGHLPGLRQVRSFGEMVTGAARKYVAQRWRVPLIDLYSTRETGYLALQCPTGESYHIQSESAYVEIVNDAGAACRPGDIGRVVVTPLHNFAFPLLRYDLGDYAQVGGSCSCGRGLPTIARILGRSRNLMKLRDGSTRWPMFGTEDFRNIAPVRQFQFVQRNYDELEIRLCVERPLTDEERTRFGEHVLANIGHPFQLHWTFMPELFPDPGGKFEDFISFHG